MSYAGNWSCVGGGRRVLSKFLEEVKESDFNDQDARGMKQLVVCGHV